jgi:hypothetical protein
MQSEIRKQCANIIYVIGIPISHPVVGIQTLGHGLILLGRYQSSNILHPPRSDLRAKLDRLRIAPFFYTRPPMGLTDRIDFQDIRKADKPDTWKRIMAHMFYSV